MTPLSDLSTLIEQLLERINVRRVAVANCKEEIATAAAEDGGYATAPACDICVDIEADIELLQQAAGALTAALHAQEARIEPLVKSDDPEVAEAMRLTPDYVLMTRDAYEGESKIWRDRRDKWKARAEAAEAQLTAALHEIAELKKTLAILSLSIPITDELADRIDESLKYLAMGDGFTLNGIARVLQDVQRRMAADWTEIGNLRAQRTAALHATCQHCGHTPDPLITHAVVVNQPDNPVAAPCALAGCQLTAAHAEIVRLKGEG